MGRSASGQSGQARIKHWARRFKAVLCRRGQRLFSSLLSNVFVAMGFADCRRHVTSLCRYLTRYLGQDG
jgi:hypothetical protein